VRILPIVLLAVLVAGVARAGGELSVRLVGTRTATAGAAWSGRLDVTPPSAGRPLVVARLGARRRPASLTRAAAGRYRVRLVLPAGRWTLAARLGARTFRLGALTVRAARPPLVLRSPEHAVVAPDGRLLVAEQGANRIVAVDPRSGAVSEVARVASPFGLARAPDGDLYVSSHEQLLRVDAGGRVTTAHRAAVDVGPVAAGAGGEILFATSEDRVYRLGAGGAVTHVAGNGRRGSDGDGGPARAASFAHPHGLAVGADGTLVVADTESGRIRRVDGRTGTVSTVARGLSEPWAAAPAPGGGAVVTERLGGRVWRVDSAGRATPVTAAGALDSPAGIAVAASGEIFVTELETGHVRRIARDGTITTLRRR
jgi:sugar lactone lactonase YvrE